MSYDVRGPSKADVAGCREPWDVHRRLLRVSAYNEMVSAAIK